MTIKELKKKKITITITNQTHFIRDKPDFEKKKLRT